MDVQIDESEIMTHILSNLPEEYQTIVEILEGILDDENHPLTIKRVSNKLLVKYNQMYKQSSKTKNIKIV